MRNRHRTPSIKFPLILHRYPGKQVHLILDNAKIHHAEVLAPFLAGHPALHLLSPISCSYHLVFPELNDVDRIGKWLREKVVLKRYFPGLVAIKTAIQGFSRFFEGDSITIRSRLCRLLSDLF